MSTAVQFARRIPAAKAKPNATTTTSTLAGVDISSWLSWACYGCGFALAIKLAPDMVDDLMAGGLGALLLAGSVAVFFVSILTIQHHMRISLRNTSFGQPQKLVDDGVFAISRNPMYVAFLLPIGSIAFYSPTAALAAGVIYVLGMNSLVITVEEEVLSASFGGQFRRYCETTPRWLFW